MTAALVTIEQIEEALIIRDGSMIAAARDLGVSARNLYARGMRWPRLGKLQRELVAQRERLAIEPSHALRALIEAAFADIRHLGGKLAGGILAT